MLGRRASFKLHRLKHSQGLLEFVPTENDMYGTQRDKFEGNLVLLMVSFIAANIANERDFGCDGGFGPGDTVLNSDAFFRLRTVLSEKVQIDGRVWLAGGLGERSGCRVCKLIKLVKEQQGDKGQLG